MTGKAGIGGGAGAASGAASTALTGAGGGCRLGRLIGHHDADERLLALLCLLRVLWLAAGEEKGQQHHDPEPDQQPFPPSPDRQRLGLFVLLPFIAGVKLAHRDFAWRMSRSTVGAVVPVPVGLPAGS